MDFMSNQLYTWTRFRTMNVLDEGNREVLAVEVAWSFPAVRVVAVLDQLVAVYGVPDAIRLDNGPEMVSEVLRAWAERHRVRLLFIQPGKPTQNASIERFNGTAGPPAIPAKLS
jgi:putative transposase